MVSLLFLTFVLFSSEEIRALNANPYFLLVYSLISPVTRIYYLKNATTVKVHHNTVYHNRVHTITMLRLDPHTAGFTATDKMCLISAFLSKY